MTYESEAITCPNPKCHKKIEEPILLNNLSTTPAEQYYACPHCFIKLDEDTENDENITQDAENIEDVTEEPTSGPPVHPSLEKVLDVISAQPQTEKKEKEEKEEKKKKEEPPVKPPEKEGKEPSGCPYQFGYLASRAKDAPIPQECLMCQKIVDCMLKRGAS